MASDPWGTNDPGAQEHLPEGSWWHWSRLEAAHLYGGVAVLVAILVGAALWVASGRPTSECRGCEVSDQVGVGLTEAGDSIQIRLVTCEPVTVDRVALYDQDGGTRWEITARQDHDETVFLTNQVFGAFEEVVPFEQVPVSTNLHGVVEADRSYTFDFNVLDLHPDQIFYRYRLWDRQAFEDAAREAACPAIDVNDTQARMAAMALMAVLGIVAYVGSGRLVAAA